MKAASFIYGGSKISYESMIDRKPLNIRNNKAKYAEKTAACKKCYYFFIIF